MSRPRSVVALFALGHARRPEEVDEVSGAGIANSDE